MKFKIEIEVGDSEQLWKIFQHLSESTLELSSSSFNEKSLDFIGGSLSVERKGIFAPYRVIDDETSEVLGYHYNERDAKLQQYSEHSAYVHYNEDCG